VNPRSLFSEYAQHNSEGNAEKLGSIARNCRADRSDHAGNIGAYSMPLLRLKNKVAKPSEFFSKLRNFYIYTPLFTIEGHGKPDKYYQQPLFNSPYTIPAKILMKNNTFFEQLAGKCIETQNYCMVDPYLDL